MTSPDRACVLLGGAVIERLAELADVDLKDREATIAVLDRLLETVERKRADVIEALDEAHAVEIARSNFEAESAIPSASARNQ